MNEAGPVQARQHLANQIVDGVAISTPTRAQRRLVDRKEKVVAPDENNSSTRAFDCSRWNASETWARTIVDTDGRGGRVLVEGPVQALERLLREHESVRQEEDVAVSVADDAPQLFERRRRAYGCLSEQPAPRRLSRIGRVEDDDQCAPIDPNLVPPLVELLRESWEPPIHRRHA